MTRPKARARLRISDWRWDRPVTGHLNTKVPMVRLLSHPVNAADQPKADSSLIQRRFKLLSGTIREFGLRRGFTFLQWRGECLSRAGGYLIGAPVKGGPDRDRERRMNKSVIRLLTLTICAMALVAVPTITPAKAAANGSQQVKKHKSHKSLRVEAPKASNQAPYYANPNDNPDRKVSY